jgi:hypothetical protein
MNSVKSLLERLLEKDETQKEKAKQQRANKARKENKEYKVRPRPEVLVTEIENSEVCVTPNLNPSAPTHKRRIQVRVNGREIQVLSDIGAKTCFPLLYVLTWVWNPRVKLFE